MDLLKIALRLSPYLPAELVGDALEVALEANCSIEHRVYIAETTSTETTRRCGRRAPLHLEPPRPRWLLCRRARSLVNKGIYIAHTIRI